MSEKTRIERLRTAEKEILSICKKYDVYLACKYEDGVCTELVAKDESPDCNDLTCIEIA